MNQPAPYTVQLKSQDGTRGFEGTLSELAFALREARVKPEHVSALELVERYLAHVDEMAGSEPEMTSALLPLLARIIELKLRLLLPRPPKPALEDEGDVIETVLALEAFEEAISFLRERRETRKHLLLARAPRPDYPRRTRPLETQLGRLAELATRHRVSHYFELAVERLTLSAAMDRLRDALRKLRFGSLEALIGQRDWATLTVGFSAMLELVKEGEVRASQEVAYGVIELETAPPVAPEPRA